MQTYLCFQHSHAVCLRLVSDIEADREGWQTCDLADLALDCRVQCMMAFVLGQDLFSQPYPVREGEFVLFCDFVRGRRSRDEGLEGGRCPTCRFTRNAESQPFRKR